MPDAPATSKSGSLGFLTRKIGPLPVWAYALIAAGIWYWYTHWGPGKPAAGGASAGAVDPSTGVTYAEELAAANQEIADLQGAAGTTPPPQPPPDTGDVSAATVAEQEQDIAAQQKAQQEQEQDISQDATQDKKKPGKGKHTPPKPHPRHNRKPGAREIPGGPVRGLGGGPVSVDRGPRPPVTGVPPRQVTPVPLSAPPAHHPNAPKAPADKATAPMTRWRAA